MCVCVWVCVLKYRYPFEAIRFPEAGVTESCKGAK